MPRHLENEGIAARMARGFTRRLREAVHPTGRMPIEQQINTYILQLQNTYKHLSEVTKQPQAMIYPAGGFDIYPLLFMEGLEELAIIDAMPFAREQANISNKDLEAIPTLSYKDKLRREVLKLKDGQIAHLDELTHDFDIDEQLTFGDYLRVIAKRNLEEQLEKGFRWFPSSYAITSRDDHIEHILGALLVAAVDLKTVKIGKFGKDFHVTFTLNGKEKRIIYRETYVEKDLAKQGEVAHAVEDLKKRFRKVRSTGYIKGDVFDLADSVIMGVAPDTVIITPRSRMEGTSGILADAYTLRRISNVPSTIRGLSLGYGFYGTIESTMIATRK